MNDVQPIPSSVFIRYLLNEESMEKLRTVHYQLRIRTVLGKGKSRTARKNRQFWTLTRAFGLGAILILGGGESGCSWTPKVETQIFAGQEGSISLITVPDQSFQASHPVQLDPKTLSRVFRGLQITHPKGLLHTLIAGKEKPKRVFSDQQVAFLTSHLVTAFAQITPEEQVTFGVNVSDTASPNWGTIKGNMAFHGTDLYLSLRYPAVDTPTTRFIPDEAIRTDPTFSWFLGKTKDHGLVINYDLLARLPDSSDPQRNSSNGSFTRGIEPGSNSLRQESSTNHFPDSGSSSPQPSRDSRVHTTSDAQSLIEEMRALRKELAAQKAEIERLKNQQGVPH